MSCNDCVSDDFCQELCGDDTYGDLGNCPIDPDCIDPAAVAGAILGALLTCCCCIGCIVFLVWLCVWGCCSAANSGNNAPVYNPNMGTGTPATKPIPVYGQATTTASVPQAAVAQPQAVPQAQVYQQPAQVPVAGAVKVGSYGDAYQTSTGLDTVKRF